MPRNHFVQGGLGSVLILKTTVKDAKERMDVFNADDWLDEGSPLMFTKKQDNLFEAGFPPSVLNLQTTVKDAKEKMNVF
jgi:hypothetical protein